MNEQPTRRIAELVADTRLSSVPRNVVETAKALIIDTVGVTVAGAAQPGARIVTTFIRTMGGSPDATVVGAPLKTSCYLAALANGTAAAILDYDDTHIKAFGHFSGCLVSAILALAQARGFSGRAALEAYIVGFEAIGKIAQAVQPAMYAGGRHSTGTLGIIGATAAASKLLGLSAPQIATAFGIAGSSAGALRANFGSMTKGLHTGSAAADGIMAAWLAADGFTANPTVLEARFGYVHNLVKDGTYDLSKIGKNWGDPWDLVDPGVGVKFQPSGTWSFCPAECALRIAERDAVSPESVADIECRVTQLSLDSSSFGVPATTAEAMYSTAWAIAVALTDRKTGLAQFGEERIRDPAVRALAGKVRLSLHPDLREGSADHDITAAELIVKLKDGRTFREFVPYPRGYPGGTPWTATMIEEKFRETAATLLSAQDIDQSLAELRHIEDLTDVRRLMARLQTTKASEPHWLSPTAGRSRTPQP